MSAPNMNCFCMHVYPGAFVIGIIGLSVNVFIGCYCLFVHSFILLLVSFLGFASCVALVIANHTESPILYWVYLALQPVLVLVRFIFSLLSISVVSGAMGFLGDLAQHPIAQQVAALYQAFFHPIGIFALMFGLIVLFYCVLEAYFFYTVLRAYGFLKWMLTNQPSFDADWKPQIYV
ncbi:hypothetical protein M3Y96_00384200 [Aphelenchoides besseyi]|nr:hypothetical protein M3Y96_00384200 [Aphelenchoides besseyi]